MNTLRRWRTNITPSEQQMAPGHYGAGFTPDTYTYATQRMRREAADTIGSIIDQAMQFQKQRQGRAFQQPARPCLWEF